MPLVAALLLAAASGCVAGNAELTQDSSGPGQVAAVDEPARLALSNGAYATPSTFGGFCADGVGVYLSAVNDSAELTLYVVWPAKSATFERPALYLTTQEGDHARTEVEEFEDVTLQAGESRSLHKQADGKLMEAFADFADGRS